MAQPTVDEAVMMVATLSPEALAAWRAVLPLIGEDSSRFIAALVEAACVTAMAAGCDPEVFAAGVKATWDRRALAFAEATGAH